MQIEYIPLEQLGFVGRGKSKHRPRNDESLYGGEYPFIQTADVKKAELYIREYSQTYNEKGLAQSKLWPKGTLCITIAANIADTAILDMEACFPDSIIGFVADKTKVNVKYVKYFYSLFQRNLQKISQGAAQDNLNLEKLLMYPIPCPSLAIQNRIVDVLGTIDDLVVCNVDLINRYKLVIEKLYFEWFHNFKFPSYENIKLVDDIPEGWEIKPINQLTQLISRGITPKYNDESGSSIVINQKCIRDNKLNLEFARRQDKEIPVSKLVQKGDVLINSTGAGTLGRVTQVHENLSDTTVDTHVTIVRPLNEISSAWFGAAISNLESYIETLGEGATNQLELKREVIGRIDLLCPTMEIQQHFQKIVEPMEQKILNLMKQNMHLLKLKETLLPRLMSGELDVSKLLSIQ
ncbi:MULTISPECIES: restriction endonuclease subunit S [Acinetobacter calcoaceticus/baumannii complex]|uniref:restriction endonuclease subunit S n=1 Tax=Acinetobacter calcoaceticus/baumannii complex TaxID=909768 RepID=UPI00148C8DAC|nr:MULTISPECIES: restriction endonuclease subunit S [Acinetobacter calcoaceticus/baumannii complex]MBR8588599.1 restriction endonuclease subunit S [Acinetobacter baumannii]MCO9044957.1 restriction endonuclease subunit S [Acinetobacter baumannii]MCO9052306.1 restriction endonuclease subunit S [Acinetobacter baumannii]MCO9055726.1 restriction endonuclease subunit S [Acinetobacter baumannii]MCO9059655.1 restriction endonuclease subunit S [Acinetobacter baumannii]